MKQHNHSIRDLLYLDFDKAASIWSQFEEGLLERESVTEDSGKDRKSGTKFGIPGVAEANLGADYLQKRSVLQSRTLHHDILNRIELSLGDRGLVTDLSRSVAERESNPGVIRSAIGERPYLRTQGAGAMRLFINTFMPTRINFRIYPFTECPSFQVLCNLKRECFVDSDLEHLLYGYGNRPNVPLAVFGLITSLPADSAEAFNPMKEFDEDPNLSQRASFEKAFRGIFGGMEGMESLVRYSRYPNITVHPIAVYRSFEMDSKKG